jgi:hypothetical protein
VKIDNFFSELTRIFHSPSQIRPKDSYFLGNSWVSPAPSTDLTDRSKRIVESFQNTQELIRFEGLLGLAERHEISGLKRRNVYKAAVAHVAVTWVVIQAASILLPAFDAPPWVTKVVVFLLVLGFPATLTSSGI